MPIMPLCSSLLIRVINSETLGGDAAVITEFILPQNDDDEASVRHFTQNSSCLV